MKKEKGSFASTSSSRGGQLEMVTLILGTIKPVYYLFIWFTRDVHPDSVERMYKRSE